MNELKNEVNDLFLLVLLEMLIRDEEAEIEALYWFLAENLELICSKREEALEHMCEKNFDFLVLLD